MPFAPRVHVEGLHELNRDFGRLSKELQKELQKELRTLAEPVAADIRRRAEAEHWGPKTISGIAAGSRYGQAIVRQRRKKTTRKRPDFGSLQMRKASHPFVAAGFVERIRGALEP